PAAVVVPPPPPQPRTVTLAAGTLIAVRTGEALDSRRTHTGDTFTATLDAPLTVDGFVIAERGARAAGPGGQGEEGGRVRGVAQIVLELTSIHTSDGQQVSINTATFDHKGPESRGEDAAKVGIGAVLGTVIGAAAGGGKGAAIGAAAGGAAGAGTVAA